MQKFINKIISGDCIKILSSVKEPFADLIFADPPFNIGYKYNGYNDNKKSDDYVAWTRRWMSACYNVLKPHGSFYIAMGDEYAANTKIIADGLGLFMRNWLIWHYTFGQQMKKKFARSHTHILYFVKDKDIFTFDADATTRVISDRQKIYSDKRANPDGKLPDDVWDEYPRVCGTFDERTGFPCQMPEGLLARIIRVSSNAGDWVLDPFSGSGTTAIVAAKLKREYTGIEISPEYADQSRKRIRQFNNLPIVDAGPGRWSRHADAELKCLYHENKVSAEGLQQSSYLLGLFTEKFNSRISNGQNHYSCDDVIERLIKIQKSGKLGPLRAKVIHSKGSSLVESQ
ncbi:MAG TPA: site-specific DNA-methyltransferase [Sedimentisphaerales bacterium]|nr:site-specific DNA-methyltransferase [Sedimentisphaerales bacterium]